MSIKTNIPATAKKAARKRTYRDSGTMDTDGQFDYDTTLLEQGRYREWFYQGLDESGRAYTQTPPRLPIRIPTKPEPTVLNGWFTEQTIWHDEAACKDADPVVFFSESHYPKKEYSAPDAAWRQYCPQCPVREACLQAARDSGSVGIWGGKIFVQGPGSLRKPLEFDDDTMPKRGRPRKAG